MDKLTYALKIMSLKVQLEVEQLLKEKDSMRSWETFILSIMVLYRFKLFNMEVK